MTIRDTDKKTPQPIQWRTGISVCLAMLPLILYTNQAYSAPLSSTFREATVFRDKNKNGLLDPKEQKGAQTTLANGSCEKPKGTGPITLIGGLDISTGVPNPLVLIAQDGSPEINALSTFGAALSGKPKATVKRILFSPPRADGSEPGDPAPSQPANGKLTPEQKKKKSSEFETLALFTSSLRDAGLGTSRGLKAQSALGKSTTTGKVVNALVKALLKTQGRVDLADSNTVKSVLRNALATLGAPLDEGNLDLVATVSAIKINLEIELLGVSPSIDYTSLLIRRQRGAEFLGQSDFQGFREFFFPRISDFKPRTGLDPARNITNSKQPTLFGQVPAGTARLFVYDSTTSLGEALLRADGSWEFTCPPLSEGPHSLHAETSSTTAPEIANKFSPPLALEVDSEAPAPPAVTSPPSTSQTAPTLTGTWTNLGSLTVTVSGLTYTTDNGLLLTAGNWSLTLPKLLPGTYPVEVLETDKAGNQSMTRSQLSILGALAPPTLDYITPDRGPSSEDGITNSNQITLHGTVIDTAARVDVYRVGETNPIRVSAIGGEWNYTVNLGQGRYIFSARAINSLDESSVESSQKVVTIDTEGPAKPTVGPRDTSSQNVQFTTQEMPTLVGTWDGTRGDKITVRFQNGPALEPLTDAATWRLTRAEQQSLLHGVSYTVEVTVSDRAGNPPATTIGTLTVNRSTLNDTGLTLCGDYASGSSNNWNRDVDCNGSDKDGDPVPIGQDATYGRDALSELRILSKKGGGRAGFDFTKMKANDGKEPEDKKNGPWACVRDNVTGLVWEVKTNDDSIRGMNRTFSNPNSTDPRDLGLDALINEAKAFNEKGGLCKETQWRLPTVHELASILDLSKSALEPAIDPEFFPNTPYIGPTGNAAAQYWTSTGYSKKPENAWNISFGLSSQGDVNNNPRSRKFFVRLVAGESYSVPPKERFIASPDGTEVTDLQTDLVWMRCSAGKNWSGSNCAGNADGTLTWLQALKLAEEAGQGWRLPSRNELLSLVDYTKRGQTIDDIFPDTDISKGYWTSSTHLIAHRAWQVYFDFGGSYAYPKDTLEGIPNEQSRGGYARLVRDRQ